MAWISARRVAAALGLGTLLLPACTRLNPAFIDQAGTGDTRTDSDSESSDSLDATSAESEVTTDSSSEESSDTGVPVCDLPWTLPLYFKIHGDFVSEACQESYSGYYLLRGSNLTSLSVDRCGTNCEGCADGSGDRVEIFPVDLADVALELEGQCIFVQYDGLFESFDDHCSYNKFMLSVQEGESIPWVIGTSFDGLTPAFANNAANGFQPTVVDDLSCDCGSGSDPCCDAADPPSRYAYDLGNGEPPLSVGGEATVDIGGEAWDFFALQAQLTDSCGAEPELSWMTVRVPG